MTAKTEPPTRGRLRRALSSGDSPLSSVSLSAAALAAALFLAPVAVAGTIDRFHTWLLRAFDGPQPVVPVNALAIDIVWIVGPLTLAGAALVALVGVIQTGGVITPSIAAPDSSRLDAGRGLARLVSSDRWLSTLRSIATGTVLGALGVWLMIHHAADLANTTGNVEAAFGLAGELTRRAGWIGLGVFVVAGAVDIAISRGAWRDRLRMSRQELREELRRTEGDPQVRRAQRRAHAALSRRGPPTS